MAISISRIKHLINRDFIIYKKPVLFGLIALMLISILILWISTLNINFHQYTLGFWSGLYFTFLFGSGLILTSIIFWEFKTPAGRLQYLNLPASHHEKLITRSFYTLILFPVILTLWFLILYYISRSLGISDSMEFIYFDIGFLFVGFYINLSAIMLIYAIRFNQYVAPKAMIISTLIYILLLILAVILVRIIMPELWTGIGLNLNSYVNFEPDFDIKVSHNKYRYLLNFLLFLVIPAYFWTVAYFKLKEKEA